MEEKEEDTEYAEQTGAQIETENENGHLLTSGPGESNGKADSVSLWNSASPKKHLLCYLLL